MKIITKILSFAILTLTLSGCSYKITKETNEVIKNPIITTSNDTRIEATTVKVGAFYDGQEGFSVSIPSGNSSTCVWTYNAGTGRVPYSVTTNAITATEKHIIYVYGEEEDLKLTCVDDFGNNYTGIFPEPNYKIYPVNKDINEEYNSIDKKVWESI
jgi:hypothetical protein